MSLLVGVVTSLFFLSSNTGTKAQVELNEPDLTYRSKYYSVLPTRIPDTYKDVFLPGSSNKKQLGSGSSTCWARGGICVDIMRCPALKMDIEITGCSWGYKVCCLVQTPTSPTVGVVRRAHLPVISSPEELGSKLMAMAERNTLAVSNLISSDIDKSEEVEHVDVDS